MSRRLALVALAVAAGSAILAAGCQPGAVRPAQVKPRKTPPADARSAGRHNGTRADRFWVRAQKEVYKSREELAARRARERQQGLHYDLLWEGNRRIPAVALTFDDGPHPDFTLKILALLKRYDIKATFFVVGKMAERYPELIRAEKAAGHVLGNHTYHHLNLTRIPAVQVATEWQACQDVVQSATGETMRFCRPPGGDYNRDVIRAATEGGLTTVMWTDDPGDYASPGDRTIEVRVFDHVSNGGIILLHDGVQQTLDVLPQVIERLRARGFRFVTVSRMRAELTASKAAG